MGVIQGFTTQLDFETGLISGAKKLIQRRLSDMHGMYADIDATEQILSAEDRLIYEVYATALPETAANILYCTTIIYPGTVGDEYHMTKGHYHSQRNRGEVYFGLAGQGYLLLQHENGDHDALPMERGTVAYVPPYYAHRTLNSGDKPFIFFAAWSGDAGHDYASIETTGFPQLVIKRNGKPQLIDNPHFA